MHILGPYWCLYVANHSNELSTVTTVSQRQQQIQISVPPFVYFKSTSHLQGLPRLSSKVVFIFVQYIMKFHWQISTFYDNKILYKIHYNIHNLLDSEKITIPEC